MTDPFSFASFLSFPPPPQVYRAGIPVLSLDLSCFSWIAHVCFGLELAMVFYLGDSYFMFSFPVSSFMFLDFVYGK